MRLQGFHHLTAVTADTTANLDFYTNTLGLRLVKRTVNQDDTSAYHLFYADGEATPGTDVTFFDWRVLPERRGSGGIVRTGLRVADDAALWFWHDRLTAAKHFPTSVDDVAGRPGFAFEDREGQRLALVVDDATGDGRPWAGSDVPAGHQVRGLGPITVSVADLGPTENVLTGLLAMTRVREYAAAASDGSKGRDATVHVFACDDPGTAGGGPAGELHVAVEPTLPRARGGSGGAHHVAFRVGSYDAYDAWADRLASYGVNGSGPVDRFYFRSLYFREPGGVLFELATDGPGFTADEPLESLGGKLSLPPFLEGRRAAIEAGLTPLVMPAK